MSMLPTRLEVIIYMKSVKICNANECRQVKLEKLLQLSLSCWDTGRHLCFCRQVCTFKMLQHVTFLNKAHNLQNAQAEQCCL